ncbi:MAG TPA: SdpI family protein [Devosia sp.]|nr:SdpI family protein [Devosia sp.]
MIRLTSPINLLLLAIGIVATAAGFLLISPNIDLPVHWGLDGQVDAMLPRNWALLQMPGAVAAVWLIFWAIGRWGNRERQQASTHVMNAALPAVTGLLILVQVLIVLVGLGYPVDVVRAIVIGLALLEIVLGNALPKSQPNWVAGIRIPTTLNDPANWQATHRLTGLLMMLGGLATFIAALLLSASGPLLIAVLAALLVPIVVGTVYSLVHAARSRRPAA